jgi:hypothetical protein
MTPTSVEVPVTNPNSIEPPDQMPSDDLTTTTPTADADEVRRALSEARAHRRMVKNLTLGGICLLLLLVTLWFLLVVGPL